MTTVTNSPDGFSNVVLSRVLLLAEVLTRRAPGRMNFEKCPM
jgi:hypothetical protein